MTHLVLTKNIINLSSSVVQVRWPAPTKQPTSDHGLATTDNCPFFSLLVWFRVHLLCSSFSSSVSFNTPLAIYTVSSAFLRVTIRTNSGSTSRGYHVLHNLLLFIITYYINFIPFFSSIYTCCLTVRNVWRRRRVPRLQQLSKAMINIFIRKESLSLSSVAVLSTFFPMPF